MDKTEILEKLRDLVCEQLRLERNEVQLDRQRTGVAHGSEPLFDCVRKFFLVCHFIILLWLFFIFCHAKKPKQPDVTSRVAPALSSGENQ